MKIPHEIGSMKSRTIGVDIISEIEKNNIFLASWIGSLTVSYLLAMYIWLF